MSDSILKFASNIFSQNGEDGIIDECVRRIKPDKTCCEFGAGNAVFCSNTYNLLKSGWKGVMIEANPLNEQAAKINLDGCKCDYIVCAVQHDNINLLVPQYLGVLSMDTDGPDASLWAAYTGKPDIVIIEINSSLDPERDYYSSDKGANFSFMNNLAETKGYFLLCHTGNCIYVLNKHKGLFPDADITFNRKWLQL